MGGRLVYWLPSTSDFKQSDLPLHPCLEVRDVVRWFVRLICFCLLCSGGQHVRTSDLEALQSLSRHDAQDCRVERGAARQSRRTRRRFVDDATLTPPLAASAAGPARRAGARRRGRSVRARSHTHALAVDDVARARASAKILNDPRRVDDLDKRRELYRPSNEASERAGNSSHDDDDNANDAAGADADDNRLGKRKQPQT